MKFVITLLFFMLLVLPSVQGQQKAPGLPAVENLQDFYRTGVGFRVGWPIAAFTVKHFIQKRTALEFIAAPQFGGASLTVLAERHHATRRPGVYWYYGLGADVGSYHGKSFPDYEGDYYEEAGNVISFGVDFIIGLEANIHETPFSVGVDVKPHIGLYNPGGSILEGAVTLKYVWSR